MLPSGASTATHIGIINSDPGIIVEHSFMNYQHIGPLNLWGADGYRRSSPLQIKPIMLAHTSHWNVKAVALITGNYYANY